MVIIYGNPLKKAYTYGREVGSIFCNRAEVWPKDVPPESYYIKWSPILSTGTFSIGGVTYNFSDYPDGVFYLSGPIITSSAFSSNSSILTIDTNVLTINNNAFYNCRSLSQVSLPVCSYIGKSAFHSCGLKQINFPACEYIAFMAFRECSSLSQVNLPVCSYIGYEAFYDCLSLSQVSLPECSYIGSWAFHSCRSLSQVSLPVCSYIGSVAFFSCISLSQVSLPVCSYIGEDAFEGCRSLSKITIGYSAVCSLYNSSVFHITPIASGTGSIYVPSSLVSAYKSASEWSYYSNRIFPIE